jgi:H+-transporting ATPase
MTIGDTQTQSKTSAARAVDKKAIGLTEAEAARRLAQYGEKTYFGRTAGLVEQAGTVSHFQRAALRIGNFLILTTAGLVVLIVVAGLFRHNPILEMGQFALILAVASIPVALPALLSVTMAVGAERLARLKAIVSRLVSIEEMAGMDTLCSDKTGTLTKNELTLGELEPSPGVKREELILAAALASRRDAPDAIDKAVLAGGPGKDTLDAYWVTAFHPLDRVAKRAEAEIMRDRTRGVAGRAARVDIGRGPGQSTQSGAGARTVQLESRRGDVPTTHRRRQKRCGRHRKAFARQRVAQTG